MDVVAQIEEVIAAHWELMGHEPPARLRDEDGLRWFETPIRQLPYNGVIRTRLSDADADGRIAAMLDRFRARGASCLWFTGPTSAPADLGARLRAHGLVVGEQTTYMAREAGDEPPAPDHEVRLVGDDDLDAYTALTLDYWEVGADERAMVIALQQRLRPSRIPGRHRFLAFADGRPAGKAFLSLAGPPGVAGIFGMSVPPELRGRGIAGALTAALLRHARDEGCERVVLQSSDIALPVYERFGFVRHGDHPVYASAELALGGTR